VEYCELAVRVVRVKYRESINYRVLLKLLSSVFALCHGVIPAGYVCVDVGMRGIKKCPTIIYRLKKYRDTDIPRYFVTSSIVDNLVNVRKPSTV